MKVARFVVSVRKNIRAGHEPAELQPGLRASFSGGMTTCMLPRPSLLKMGVGTGSHPESC